MSLDKRQLDDITARLAGTYGQPEGRHDPELELELADLLSEHDYGWLDALVWQDTQWKRQGYARPH
jgi:hypothetical protein